MRRVCYCAAKVSHDNDLQTSSVPERIASYLVTSIQLEEPPLSDDLFLYKDNKTE